MNVLLVDDHWVNELGIRECLSEYSLESKLYSCRSFRDVEYHLDDLMRNIQLAIIDILLPHQKKDGFDINEYIKNKHPSIRTIAYTYSIDYSYLKQAMNVGFNGFLNKEQKKDEIIDIIRNVMGNSLTSFYKNSYVKNKLQKVRGHADTKITSGLDWIYTTRKKRKLAILLELKQNKLLKEIAANSINPTKKKGLKNRTIQKHIAELKEELGFNTLDELKYFAEEFEHDIRKAIERRSNG